MEVTLKLDQWEIQSALTFLVDETKFTEEKAKEINDFWSNEDERLMACGTNIRAALKLYAVECFRLAGSGNMRDEEWVVEQFDWGNGKGVEGFGTACFEYDRISKLDPWKTSMLVKVKRSISDEGGGDDEDDVDLT